MNVPEDSHRTVRKPMEFFQLKLGAIPTSQEHPPVGCSQVDSEEVRSLFHR
jgi:hypothetical protein